MQSEQQSTPVLENVKYPSDWHIGLSADLAQKFNDAVLCAREWGQSPTEDLFNNMIALYKQALIGDCNIGTLKIPN